MHVVLYDVDSRIPNLALMKLSSYWKKRGASVELARRTVQLPADAWYASAVFTTVGSRRRVSELRTIMATRW